MAVESTEAPWLDLPIVCPHCGSHSEPDGAWQANAGMPFKLIEEVVRSWEFEAVEQDGVLRLTADASSDSMDGESGTNLRIECMQCFGSFALPDGAEVEFE